MELPLIILGELPTLVEEGNHNGFNNALEEGGEFMEASEYVYAYAFTAPVTQEQSASWAIDTQAIGPDNFTNPAFDLIKFANLV